MIAETPIVATSNRRAIAIGRALLVLIWLCAGVAAGAIGLELAFKVRTDSRLRQAASLNVAPNRHRLEAAYDPFIMMHLDPQYMFFFLRDPRARVAISNATCHLDADGFRGPGPADAGGRPLAFLLGGSAAFGMLASSDATTITGYLNRLQDKYFFVDAGVPGWNSTQEMFRLLFQILEYRPALIVAYDGANDADRTSNDRSVGLPDGFIDLSALAGEAGSESRPGPVALLAAYLFPELKERIDKVFGRPAQGAADGLAPIPESLLQAGVARYVTNLSRMSDLAKVHGARFVAVFQPVAQLHRHLGAGPLDGFPVIERFHRAALDHIPHGLEFHDLGDVFDQHYATIPVANPEITSQSVFVDRVHLYDPGNEIVARHLAAFIR